jgi:hypothetical protein
MEYLGTIIIVIIVLVLVFLLLREVNCWYWKINKRIELMEDQNNLLRSLLSDSNPQGKTDTDKVIQKPQEDNIKTYKSNTVTYRHKVTNNVETVDLEYWEKMKKMYGEENYELIEIHK